MALMRDICQRLLTLISLETCLIFFFLLLNKDDLLKTKICTVKVNEDQCCFGPHLLSLYEF